MAAIPNVAVVASAIPADIYLGNYAYADIVSDMEPLRFKLDTAGSNRIFYKNAAGALGKLMTDASAGTNHAATRVFFADANGACDSDMEFLYSGTALLMGVPVTHKSSEETGIFFDSVSEVSLRAGLAQIFDAEMTVAATAWVARINYSMVDCDTDIYSALGLALHVRGSDGVVQIGGADAPAWKTATYNVLDVGGALYGTGYSVGLVAGGYYDITSDRWELEAASPPVRIELNNTSGLTVIGDRNAGSTGAGGEWQEIDMLHVKITGAGAGEVVINESASGVITRIETATLTHAVFVDAPNDRIGLGTATPDAFVHVERTTAATDAVTRFLRLTHLSSGTPADGFGTGIEFELDNSTQATHFVAGAVDVIWEDDSAIDSDMIFRAMDGGSLVEGARLTSAKAFSVGGGAVRLSTGDYPSVSVTTNSTSAGDAAMLTAGYASSNVELAYWYSYNKKSSLSNAVAGIAILRDGADDAASIRLRTRTTAGALADRVVIDSTGKVYLAAIASGATQAAASAVAGQLWKTASHATLPDNIVMIGV